MGNDPVYKQVGRRIRTRRLQLGMTLEDLAHSASRHPTYVGQIERGGRNASLTTLNYLADALGLHLRELFETGPAAPESPLERKIGALLRKYGKREKKILLSTLRHLAKELEFLRRGAPKAAA